MKITSSALVRVDSASHVLIADRLEQSLYEPALDSFEARTSRQAQFSSKFPVPQRELMARDLYSGDGLCEDDFVKASVLPLSLKSMKLGERERDACNEVIYLTRAQRENYELQARDGQLFRKDGVTPFNTKRFYGESSLLFVISKKGEIYAARGAYHQLHHSSLLAGKDVQAAGKIVSLDGKIIRLTNSSGHYRPQAHHLLQAVYYFHRLGVLSPDATVQIRHQGEFPLKEAVAVLISLILDAEAQMNMEL